MTENREKQVKVSGLKCEAGHFSTFPHDVFVISVFQIENDRTVNGSVYHFGTFSDK